MDRIKLSPAVFKIFFFFLILLYFFLYAFYGYNDTDDGYTMALSWRIFNGEVPYKDFILVRPLLSPMIHTLPLFIIPDNYQVLFERLLFYASLGGSSLLGALSISKAFATNEFSLDSYLLASVGFVFSVHCFPPIPWHTVDGIFLSALGIYLLSRSLSIVSIAIGITALFLAALCKQSFYLMPFAGISYVFLTGNRKKAFTAVTFLSLNGVGFFLFLYRYGIAKQFLEFTSGSTSVYDLLTAGFVKYTEIDLFYFLIPLALFLIIYRFRGRFLLGLSLVPFSIITLLLVFPLLQLYPIIDIVYYSKSVTFFEDKTAPFLFVMAVLLLIACGSLKKKWLTLSFLLLVSWSAGISWGYQTPVLFSVPLLFAFFFVSFHYFKVKNIAVLAVYTLLSGTVVYYSAYQKPYRNPYRSELNYELEAYFPKLKFIKVGKETFTKYQDLKSLTLKYGSNFKTLPSMPLANFLTDTKSPIQIDWVFNAETGKYNNSIYKKLVEAKAAVFLEKNPSPITVVESESSFNSSVSNLVKNKWQLIDSNSHFYVYVSPLSIR